ncbi:hypothetical protein ADL22_21220 [Streptomyces sp. NRRL F-4489]|uniref:hypothetical protein n=1 Tax=Streptomyces sp. NRRL F-4489 TaxID=1609095 RepID=UPI0007498808|nr:hypothetical protein [Streptomyces sp. NRRL F-4489]KUL37483.1 hypothetical protein ADL22_21220 [Streptomyces sp. NRRL F-4489]
MTEAGPGRDGAAEMERRRDERERAERLKSLQGQRMTPRSPSGFQKRPLPELQAMIEHASPEAIETSGRQWRSSADLLGGEDGHGGIRKAFRDAVEHACAHWEGTAAQAFRREAAKVLAKIDRSYQHARNAESTLIGTRTAGPEIGVAHNLREAMKAMTRLRLAGAGDDPTAAAPGADEAQFKRDMANPKLDTRMALELNRGSLPPARQRQVEAAIVMDELAAHYEAQGERLREGTGQGLDGDWPVAPSGRPAPPPVNVAVTGGPAPDKPAAAQRPNGAGGGAVPAGFDSPRGDRPVATGLAAVHGGTLTAPHTAIPVATGPAAGPAQAPATPPAPVAGALLPGVIGVAGGAPRAAGARGTGGTARSDGSGRNASGGAGSPDAVAARAALAGRMPAAPVAAAKPDGPAGGSKQGGAGLHRSRGGARGTAADPAAGPGPVRGDHGGRAGTAGTSSGTSGPGARGRADRRPGYLDEDDPDTAPRREIAPPVIE